MDNDMAPGTIAAIEVQETGANEMLTATALELMHWRSLCLDNAVYSATQVLRWLQSADHSDEELIARLQGFVDSNTP